jgi:hypothetical protein
MTAQQKTNLAKIADWAAKIIIGIILFYIAANYEKISERNERIDRKLDRIEFVEKSKETDARIREIERYQNEQMNLLIEIRNDVRWMRKIKE